MRPFLPSALVAALLLVAAGSAEGRSSGGSFHFHSSGGTTHVRGYVRKDGTYVHPHERHEGGSRAFAVPRTERDHSGTSSRLHASSRHDGSSGVPDASGIRRDPHGRIERSESAKREFERENPCPSTGRTSGPCPGYVIDHIQALKHGGADSPSNMQWQTIEAAKAKDRWE